MDLSSQEPADHGSFRPKTYQGLVAKYTLESTQREFLPNMDELNGTFKMIDDSERPTEKEIAMIREARENYLRANEVVEKYVDSILEITQYFDEKYDTEEFRDSVIGD